MLERVVKGNYIQVKIGDKWFLKHVFLWNCAHPDNKRKDNEVIIFLDGNKRNFNIDNLYKLTKGELVLLNRWYKVSDNPNETLDYIALIKLKQKRIEIAKENGLTNSYGAIIEDKNQANRKYYNAHPEKLEYYREYQRRKRQDPLWREEHNRKRREKRKSLQTK